MKGIILAVLILLAGGAWCDDRIQLINFYQATGGEHWANNEGWLEPFVPICQWHGVSCGAGKPIGLSLAGNGLEGELNPAFLPMSLSEIDLSNNQLTGDFSSNWLLGRDLIALDLSGNRLTGLLDEGLLAVDSFFPNSEWLSELNLCWNDLAISSEAVRDWLETYHRGGNAELCFGVERAPLELSLSGSYFDPDRVGEGTTLHLLDDGSALVYWFTYDYNLGQRWLFGHIGDVDLQQPSLDFNMLSPNQVQATDGTLLLDGYRHGGLEYDRLANGSMGAVQSYEINISVSGFEPAPRGLRQEHVVLSQVAGTRCEDPELPALSGLWHNPDIDLDGFVVEVLPNGSALVYWFTWDLTLWNRQAWMVGQASLQISENPAEPHVLLIDELLQPVGTRWGPRFDPNEIEILDAGSLALEFQDEMNAVMSFDSRLENLASRTYSLERLTRTRLADCD